MRKFWCHLFQVRGITFSVSGGQVQRSPLVVAEVVQPDPPLGVEVLQQLPVAVHGGAVEGCIVPSIVTEMFNFRTIKDMLYLSSWEANHRVILRRE